jgi:hypothetical protein
MLISVQAVLACVFCTTTTCVRTSLTDNTIVATSFFVGVVAKFELASIGKYHGIWPNSPGKAGLAVAPLLVVAWLCAGVCAVAGVVCSGAVPQLP